MALLERFEAKIDRENLRAGIISSTIANRHRTKREPNYTPKHFFDFAERPIDDVPKSPELLLQYWQTFVVPHFNSRSENGKGN